MTNKMDSLKLYTDVIPMDQHLVLDMTFAYGTTLQVIGILWKIVTEAIPSPRVFFIWF